MTTSLKTAKSETSMIAMDAIYHRRAVRDYRPEKIDEAVIRKLLDAAVHAPTAIHEEPWAFAIIQDKALLKRLSDNVKELLLSGADPIHPLLRGHGAGRFTSPEFNAFYDAGTLVVTLGCQLSSSSTCFLS